MSCGLLSLIRDGVAAGTKLVGAVWDDFLAGFNDDFGERVARAEAGFAADGLAEAEEQVEALEPNALLGPYTAPEYFMPAECRCPSCLDEIAADCPICQDEVVAEPESIPLTCKCEHPNHFGHQCAQCSCRAGIYPAKASMYCRECRTAISGPDVRVRDIGGGAFVYYCPLCYADYLQESSPGVYASADKGERSRPVDDPPVPAGTTKLEADKVVEAFIAAEEKRGEIAAILQDALGDNYDWAPSSLPHHTLAFFHDMKCDDGTVIPGVHHGFDWDGVVYDLFREFDIRKK